MSGFGPNMRKGRGFNTVPEESDYMLTCKLTTYGWAKNFFCAGSVVDGLYLFSSDNKLKEVVVRNWSDGM